MACWRICLLLLFPIFHTLSEAYNCQVQEEILAVQGKYNLERRTIPLSIGVLLPESYRPRVEAPIELALAHIYADGHLLSDYCLRLIYKYTQCRTSLGMKALFDLMNAKHNYSIPREGDVYSEEEKTEEEHGVSEENDGGNVRAGKLSHRPVALFGDICTNVNEPVAMAAKYWGLLHLSFAETHSKFTTAESSELYPTFFRIVPGDRTVISARCQLIRTFNWTRVGSIKQSDDAVYSLPHERLVARLEDDYGVRVVYTAGLSSDSQSSIGYELDELKSRDAHIIVGDFSAALAVHILCSAHAKGMYGPNYQWILPGYHNTNWWREALEAEQAVLGNCTSTQMAEVLQGHFAVEYVPIRPYSRERLVGGSKGVGEIQRQLRELCMRKEGSPCPENIHSSYAYDGLWAIALALNASIYGGVRAKGNNKQDSEEKLLLSATRKISFEGLSGRVRFDENNERLGLVHILQWMDGAYSKVGYYDSSSSSGGGDATNGGSFQLMVAVSGWEPPLDATVVVHQRQYISTWLLVSMSLLGVFGIVLALTFFFVNVHYRNHRFIRMSSPNMNNLIIAGSICAYSAVLLLGIDTRLVSAQTFERLCYAKTWVLSVGFTLAFGAMFSKTWRVHSIFTNIRRDKKAIKDLQLYLIVAGILLTDAVVLSLWGMVSPFHFSITMQEQIRTHNLVIIPELERCESQHSLVFQVLFYVFKGMLMLFGCFLAWETRAVNVPALNDSKYIGMSVYIVVVMCVVGLSLAFILQDRVNDAFALISFFIIFCTTLTLLLVFVPKMVEVVRTPLGMDQYRYKQGMMKSMTSSKVSREEKLSQQLSFQNSEGVREKITKLEGENSRLHEVLVKKSAELWDLLERLRSLGDTDCEGYEKDSLTAMKGWSCLGPQLVAGGTEFSSIGTPSRGELETSSSANRERISRRSSDSSNRKDK